jgi:hypothetical protein
MSRAESSTADASSSSSSSARLRAAVKQLVQENATLVRELAAATRGRATWASELADARAETDTQRTRASAVEAETAKLREQLASTRRELLLVTEDRDYLRAHGSGHGGHGGTGGDDDDDRGGTLAEAFQRLKDDHDEVVDRLAQSGKQIDDLKRKLAAATAAATAPGAATLAAPRFADPNGGGESSDSAEAAAARRQLPQLQKRIAELERECVELRQQRELFVDNDRRSAEKTARDVSEMQMWSSLMRNLVTSLRQVRSHWEAEVGGDDEAVTRFVMANVETEAGRHIMENLSRVSGQLKKNAGGGGATSSASSAALAMTTSTAVSTGVSGASADVDNFTLHLRPAVNDVLRLVHGAFSDCAFLWARLKQEQHQVQLAAAKTAQPAGPAANGSTSWGLWGR